MGHCDNESAAAAAVESRWMMHLHCCLGRQELLLACGACACPLGAVVVWWCVETQESGAQLIVEMISCVVRKGAQVKLSLGQV